MCVSITFIRFLILLNLVLEVHFKRTFRIVDIVETDLDDLFIDPSVLLMIIDLIVMIIYLLLCI